MQNLKHLRMEKHLNQKEFAERIGVTSQHISNIESGNVVPSVKLAKKFGEFFDIHWTEFLE